MDHKLISWLVKRNAYKSLLMHLNKSTVTVFFLSFPYKILISYLKSFGNKLPQIKSIYLSGSIARGKQVYGLSDIDFFVICDCNPLELKKVQDILLNKFVKLKFFGQESDIKKNIFIYNEKSLDNSISMQKSILKLNESKLLYGKDIRESIQLSSMDIISYVELQIIQIFRMIKDSKLDKRAIEKTLHSLNSFFSNNSFSQFFTSKKSLKIKNLEDFFNKLNSIQFTENSYETLIITNNELSNLSNRDYDLGDNFHSPIPMNDPEQLFLDFSHTDNLVEALKEINFDEYSNFKMTFKFKSFVISTSPLGIMINHYFRVPFFWKEENIHSDAYKDLKSKYLKFKENNYDYYYCPFFQNDKKNLSYLLALGDSKIKQDISTFNFYGKIIENKVVPQIHDLEYYDSLDQIRDIYQIQKEDKTNTLSLCICTKNRAQGLAKLLTSITQQTDSPDEVIILNHSSSDNTEEIIKKFSNQLPITSYIMPENMTISSLRDECVKKSNSDIIAFTDDDAIVSEDWIYHIRKSFKSDDHLSLLGGSMNHWRQDKNSSTELFHRYFLGRRS